MKKATIFIAVLMLLSCQRFKRAETHFEKGEGDLRYKMVEDVGGETIKEDDFVGLTYSERTEEGKVVFNSADEDGRVVQMFRERSYFAGDLFSGLGLLSEGDSAVFKINLDSLLRHQRRIRPETKGKYLIFTVKVNKVVARGKLNDSIYNAAIQAYIKQQTDLAQRQETSKFNTYLASKKQKPLVTASGLNYIINQRGKGRRAIWGDTVLINYTAKYLSGKVIETSSAEVAKIAGIYRDRRPYGPLKLVLSKSSSLSGFDEALMMFPEGTRYTLIIPSRLAYGWDGRNNIKPYTSLICEVDLIDIK